MATQASVRFSKAQNTIQASQECQPRRWISDKSLARMIVDHLARDIYCISAN